MAYSTPRILGFGRQSSLAEVVKLAEEEMARTHGRPQRLLADAEGVQIEADRSRTDGPLDMYVIRLRADGDLLDSVRKLAAKTPALPLKETEGACELRASGDSKTGASPALAALSNLIALPEVWHVSVEDARKVPLSV